jgi:hypothetical protein
MNPPIVYEETKPSNQRAIKMIAIVSSMVLYSCNDEIIFHMLNEPLKPAYNPGP